MYFAVIACLLLAGIAFIIIGIKAKTKTLKMKSIWGVKSDEVRANKETWQASHHAIWFTFVLQGIIIILACIASLLIIVAGYSKNFATFTTILAGIAVIILAVFQVNKANQVAQEMHDK